MTRRIPRAGFGLLVALAAGVAIVALPAAASARDRNHDRIPDRWEKRFHLSLRVNQAHRDQDHDGLTNRQEFRAGDNPRRADTDDDGVRDDEENAGTIASFDGSRLTIDLFGGGSVSGMVTAATEIKCEARGETDGSNRGPGARMGARDPGGDDHRANCTRADLDRGTVVHEAKLEQTSGGRVFDEVELVRNTLRDG